MRLYIPATLNELRGVRNTITLQPRRAHTATPELVSELAAEGITDIEEVEYAAHLAAAHDSLMLIVEQPEVPWQRLIISLDVPDDAVGQVTEGADDDEVSASAVELTRELTDVPIVCIHVDEMEAAEDIQGIFGGEEGAVDALVDRELLWYDASEITEFTAEEE
ncbi:DUF6912 family protein [Jonesia quinghaiensis]|uniref:DUF6912 family protein n=1 Tax=Jonesia quinghaiensis TaxID=262806 RepID=UPI0003FF262E|nr:hypothetical protein [Jonesia quinghaiensis]